MNVKNSKMALKIKDLNQLTQILKKNVYENYDLNKYFSNDQFDKYYLDIKKYRKARSE